MKKITITKYIHNALVDTFEARARNFDLKGKEFVQAQTEFFAGAIRVIDIINKPTEESCITPKLYFSILRGEKINKID